MCDINTIPATYQRLREEGYKVSMNTLRSWVRNGTLPAVLCGEKRPRALISYENVTLPGALSDALGILSLRKDEGYGINRT